MKTLFARFLKDESGATAIEYGLIAAGISVAIIAVVNGLGTKLNTTFSQHLQPAELSVVLAGYEGAPVDAGALSLSGACSARPLTHSQPAAG